MNLANRFRSTLKLSGRNNSPFMKGRTRSGVGCLGRSLEDSVALSVPIFLRNAKRISTAIANANNKKICPLSLSFPQRGKDTRVLLSPLGERPREGVAVESVNSNFFFVHLGNEKIFSRADNCVCIRPNKIFFTKNSCGDGSSVLRYCKSSMQYYRYCF